VRNKIDLSGAAAGAGEARGVPVVRLCASSGEGIESLRRHLEQVMGFSASAGEGGFIARRRHLEALAAAREALARGRVQLAEARAGELLAEELRQAQETLAEITGAFSSDDLLGRIFASFCIGK
jgi:tRNA modification GTPase